MREIREWAAQSFKGISARPAAATPAARPARVQDLVEAAARLLEDQYTVLDLTPASIARAASVHQADVEAACRDFKDFLALLLQHLLDRIRTEVVAATMNEPASLERMRRGIEAWLDAHLRAPYVHDLARLLHEYRSAREIVQRRHRGTELIFLLEFDVIGVTQAAANAREVYAMTLGIAHDEYAAGQSLALRRAVLYSHLSNLALPAIAA